jgi:hypothetical protein
MDTSPESMSYRPNFVDEESEGILELKCCGVLFDLPMKENRPYCPTANCLESWMRSS